MIDDSIYTYKRRTLVENNTLKFSFKYDLTKEITEIDAADMIVYCCQSDYRFQELCNYMEYGEDSTIDEFLAVVNAYRKILLEDNL